MPPRTVLRPAAGYLTRNLPVIPSSAWRGTVHTNRSEPDLLATILNDADFPFVRYAVPFLSDGMSKSCGALPLFVTLNVTTVPLGTLDLDSLNLKSTAVTLTVTAAVRRGLRGEGRLGRDRKHRCDRDHQRLQFASLSTPPRSVTTDRLVSRGGVPPRDVSFQGTYDGSAKA